MALLGTLAEFHVDDVLVLLAGTKKTGVLVVEGNARAGRLWVDSGHIVGSEMGDNKEAGEVVFELLRLPDGKFAFESGAMPASLGAPQDVQTVLSQARAKLAEWREIERVVPSLASVVALNAAAGDNGPISIGSDEWRTIAAIGAGGSAGEIAHRLSLSEFGACKAIKAVVDAGLALVSPVADAPSVQANGAAATATAESSLVSQLTALRSE